MGSTGAAATWTIPVCVRAGIGERVEQVCTLLAAPTGTLALPGCADWVLPNAGAAGYYRAALPAAELARLRGIRALSTVERLMLAHDVEAGFRSGALTGGDALRALEPFAHDGHGAVALVPLDVLGFVDTWMVSGAARTALRARVARLYAPAVASLGWRPAPGDKPWRRLFRTSLLSILALDFEDPRLLAAAARLGDRMLGLGPDHARHADEVAPDLAGLALAAAARRGGAATFDALVADLMGSADAQIRSRVLLALGNLRDPAQVARALDLALDPRLRQNERLIAFKLLAGRAATRDAAWAWLQANFDHLAGLLPDRFGGQIPSMFEICDRGWADQLRAFFAPRVDQLTGGPRNLAQALEVAEQCAARVAAQQDSVQRYLR